MNITSMRTEGASTTITATLAQGETAPSVGDTITTAAGGAGVVVGVDGSTVTISADEALAAAVRAGVTVATEV